MSTAENGKYRTGRFKEFFKENSDQIVDILIRKSKVNGLIDQGVIIKTTSESYIKPSLFMKWVENIFYDDFYDFDDDWEEEDE